MQKSGNGKPSKRNWSSKAKSNNSLASDESKLKSRSERFNKSNETSAGRGIGGYGFVSRGEDDRLQRSERERKLFFEKIFNDFMNYCIQSDSSLKEKVKELANSSDEAVQIGEDMNGLTITEDRKIHAQDRKTPTTNLDSILTSLRKLREALLFAKPDDFSKRVFLFSIRISASIGQYHTYIPSINYLLENAKSLLTQIEIAEVATLLALHLAHFNNHNLRAIEVYYKYNIENVSLLRCLKAWAVGDFQNWTRIYNTECDGCKSAIMRMGLTKILNSMVKVMTAAYFSLDKSYLEDCVLPNGVDVSVLVEKYNCSWKVDDKVVILRERAKKPI
ncbi:hypothetical protein CLIB1423_24S00430 [[Candida] railenensis]|uniref:CSN8/PSMD8/EIF3K domain-containing protein n=1 Tax=[Candida] railenensis TaxID=45579 RepID=A0A9P0QVA7_9ASCO|nr:hypothetical protein CLIB1423_24S00430 [[Candida] railenensis]